MSRCAVLTLLTAFALMLGNPVHAQESPNSAPEGAGSTFGSWLKRLGKGIDEAVQGAVQGGNSAVGAINQTHSAVNGTVRGRVALQSGKTATCFHGIEACYLGAANMTSPGQAQGVPLMLILPDGRASANNADQLANLGVLILPASASTNKGETGYSDGLGCTDPSWTKDEIVRRRREIMDCQADATTERAAQRARARQQGSDASRQQAQRQLEDETRAKFEALQREAAKPQR